MRSRSLVRLGEEVPNAHEQHRLRVLVADFGLGLSASPQGSFPSGAEIVEGAERFAQHAGAFRPDVVVLFDVPFAGRRYVRLDESFAARVLEPGRDVEPLDIAGLLAVELDRQHRVEMISNVRRARAPGQSRQASPGRVAWGPMLLSELPLESVVEHGSGPGADPALPWESAAVNLSAALRTGPLSVTPLWVRDGVPPEGAERGGVEVTRSQTPCDARDFSISAARPGGGFLCLSVGDGVRILRGSSNATLGESIHGSALRVEIELSN